MLKPGWSHRQYEKVKADLDQLPEWVKRSVMAQEVASTTEKDAGDEGSEQRTESEREKTGSQH